jgi:amidophosphoribosyltransferase
LVLIAEMIPIPQLTDHYFTGDYPVKPIDELGDNKVTQLSLLSTASNN